MTLTQQDYELKPNETIAQYNARIAAANPNLPAPGTTSATGVTNKAVAIKPNQTLTEYQSQVSDSNPNISFQSGVAAITPTLDASQSALLSKKYGLDGIGYGSKFVGLTPGEAEQEAAKAKSAALSQTSANTSYSFNPAIMSGAKKTLDTFNTKISDTMNNGWNSQGTKDSLVKGLTESTANDYAKLFDSPAQFDALYGSNADFKNNIDTFVKAGGDVNSIKSRITAPTSGDPGTNSRRAAVLGLVQQGVSDPAQILSYMDEAAKASGQTNSGMTIDEVNSYINGGNGNQNLTQYLSGNTAPEQAAYDSLIPERQQQQAEVAQLANVPQEYVDLYFGTPDQVGIYENKRIQAEQKKKDLVAKEASDEDTLRTQADTAIAQNEADFTIADAKIQENRLAARNYITGRLAALGALNTTGAAAVEIGTIEQKYQQQSQDLRTSTDMANKRIHSDLITKVNDTQVKLDSDIYNIQTDLSKSEDDIRTEIFKATQDAQKQISTIVMKAATDLRTQKEKYTKQATDEADANAKEFAKAALDAENLKIRKAQLAISQGNLNARLGKSSGTGGVTPASKTSFVNSTSASLEKSRGADNYVDPNLYLNAYTTYTQKYGTAKQFLAAFPPSQYVNPANTTLPASLRNIPKAKSSASTTTGRAVNP